MRNTLASMIPQAKLQPSAARSMVRTSMLSAVTTPSVKVKVSAMINPNRTSEILSMGSRIRSDDLAESGVRGSAAVVVGSGGIVLTHVGVLALLVLAVEYTIESHHSVDLTSLFVQAVGAQQVARSSMRPDDAQCDALGGELAMQLVQHAGAGEIDIGRGGKIADHQADAGRAG